MSDPDVFDDLLASLGGFYRSWLIYLGLELGLFEALRDASHDGLTPAALAATTGTHDDAVDLWAWAADAHQLAELDDGRLRIDPGLAATLLDRDRTDYLGGQFVHGVVATLDWDRMVDFFRTGTPIRERPDRYRTAVERLTQQDIAVFFQEALAELPQVVAELSVGGRVADVHCGGGRWLVAMARRFPNLDLVGVEFEADSVARARQYVEEEGLGNRIRIVQADVSKLTEPGTYNLVYFQYALHQLPDAVDGLRTAWQALAPGGRVLLEMGTPGDRTDEIIRGVGELAARGADRVVIGHKEHYLRGREVDDLTALLREGAAAVGVDDVPSYPTELAGLEALLAEARPGDAVGVMCHAERVEISDWLGGQGATVDSPGDVRAKVLKAAVR